MTELLRHIRACHDASLPGSRLPVLVAGVQVGWVLPEFAARASSCGARLDERGLAVDAPALPGLARALADAGALWWRDEPFDVRALDATTDRDPAIAQIDRGALPQFGIAAFGAHLNGLVGDRLWVARRSPHKRLDPGKLDHLVAGGVPAGHTIRQTLEKEAAEEAGLPAALVRAAEPVAILRYATEREEGLRRDVLHCFDLELPPDFVPEPHDDEVDDFELWPLADVEDRLRRTDDFKFNVALVLIDLLLRRDRLPPAEAAILRAALIEPAISP